MNRREALYNPLSNGDLDTDVDISTDLSINNHFNINPADLKSNNNRGNKFQFYLIWQILVIVLLIIVVYSVNQFNTQQLLFANTIKRFEGAIRTNSNAAPVFAHKSEDNIIQSSNGLHYNAEAKEIETPISPGFKLCLENPLIERTNFDLMVESEKNLIEWTGNQLRRIYDLVNAGKNEVELGKSEFHLAFNPQKPFPCPTQIKRYGGTNFGGDGGKLLCGLDLFRSPCVVYSLGSSNIFDFEEAILSTGCEFRVFDCFTDAPPKAIANLTFHKQCLGRDTGDGKFRSLGQLMIEHKTKFVNLLKMDIEDAEHGVFADILTLNSPVKLPYQISFESHDWYRTYSQSMIHLAYYNQLLRVGYRFVSHEPNVRSPHCTEFTVVRAFC